MTVFPFISLFLCTHLCHGQVLSQLLNEQLRKAGNGSRIETIVKIMLKQFENPSGNIESGVPCHRHWWGKPAPCDIHMKITFQPKPYLSAIAPILKDLGQLTYGSNKIVFQPDIQYGQWTNPEVFIYDGPWQGFVLEVEVFDVSWYVKDYLPICNIYLIVDDRFRQDSILVTEARNRRRGDILFSFDYDVAEVGDKTKTPTPVALPFTLTAISERPATSSVTPGNIPDIATKISHEPDSLVDTMTPPALEQKLTAATTTTAAAGTSVTPAAETGPGAHVVITLNKFHNPSGKRLDGSECAAGTRCVTKMQVNITPKTPNCQGKTIRNSAALFANNEVSNKVPFNFALYFRYGTWRNPEKFDFPERWRGLTTEVFIYEEVDSTRFPVARFVTGVTAPDRRGTVTVTLDRGPAAGDATFSFTYKVDLISNSSTDITTTVGVKVVRDALSTITLPETTKSRTTESSRPPPSTPSTTNASGSEASADVDTTPITSNASVATESTTRRSAVPIITIPHATSQNATEATGAEGISTQSLITRKDLSRSATAASITVTPADENSVSIMLMYLSNENGALANGAACHKQLWGLPIACDLHMDIQLQPKGGDRVFFSSLGKLTSNNNSVNFSSGQWYNEWWNPMTFTFYQHYDGFLMTVDIYDVNWYTGERLPIDRIVIGLSKSDMRGEINVNHAKTRANAIRLQFTYKVFTHQHDIAAATDRSLFATNRQFETVKKISMIKVPLWE